MTHRVCSFQGCFKRLNSTANICPSCAIKDRRRKRRQKDSPSETSGTQTRLFGGSPREQLLSWYNRRGDDDADDGVIAVAMDNLERVF